MINTSLLETLRDLPRREKLRVIEFLAADLAQADSSLDIYPVSTPYGQDEAAAVLQGLLDEQVSDCR